MATRSVGGVSVTTGGSLSLHAAWLASLVHGGGGEADMLLRRSSHHEGWDVDHLLANSDVSLSDKHASVMDRLGELALNDESLKTTLHELGNGESQDVIKFAFGFLEETESDHTGDEGVSCRSKVKLTIDSDYN